MLITAIVACEVGFWLVLAAGLVARYVLRRRRLGMVLLAAVPLVDLALLVLTVVDLRRGTAPAAEHGLAAVYLGFSVAFGHRMIQWADVRFAARFAGGPPPAPMPPSGTVERVRWAWADFARAGVGAGVTALLLLGAAALVADTGDAGPLIGWLPRLGVILAIWLVASPVWESAALVLAPRRSDASPAEQLTPSGRAETR